MNLKKMLVTVVKTLVTVGIFVSLFVEFGGGPVGVESLAAAVQEDKSTLEDVHEPYLIQAGYLERTGRGRQVTKDALEHFKRPTSLLY